MDGVSRGFSNRDNGAGIRLYWVVDEPSAAYLANPSDGDASAWARDHRNTAQLGEFVHVMFTGNPAAANVEGFTMEHNTGGVVANGRGCFIFPDRLLLSAPAGSFLPYMAGTIAHELGHAIMEADNQPGFDVDEHEAPGDPRFLMVSGAFRTPRTAIVFSDTALVQIDLTRKESVDL